jgi:hypothetical protein
MSHRATEVRACARPDVIVAQQNLGLLVAMARASVNIALEGVLAFKSILSENVLWKELALQLSSIKYKERVSWLLQAMSPFRNSCSLIDLACRVDADCKCVCIFNSSTTGVAYDALDIIAGQPPALTKTFEVRIDGSVGIAFLFGDSLLFAMFLSGLKVITKVLTCSEPLQQVWDEHEATVTVKTTGFHSVVCFKNSSDLLALRRILETSDRDSQLSDIFG